MNVYLSEGGSPIRGDFVLSWVLRSALAPIPRTLELTLRSTAALVDAIKEGGKLWTGRDLAKFHIVKVERPRPAALVQGSEQLALIKVTALLDACHKVAFRLPRAIIRERATFGEIYRACGAEAAVSGDFEVRAFTCFKGSVPTFPIAQALQEEAGILTYADGKFRFMRIDDALKREPVQELDGDVGLDGVSQFGERHQIPSFISLDDAGAVVRGNVEKDRATAYSPRTGARELFNLTKVLVERRIVEANLASHIQAGDVVRAAGEALVVTTAVHVFEQDAENQGATNTYSRLWLAGVSK